MVSPSLRTLEPRVPPSVDDAWLVCRLGRCARGWGGWDTWGDAEPRGAQASSLRLRSHGEDYASHLQCDEASGWRWFLPGWRESTDEWRAAACWVRCRVVQRGRPSECGPPDLSAGVWLPWLDGASWDREPRAGPGRQGRVGGSLWDGSPESRGHLQVVVILVNSWVWVRHRGGGAEPPEGERGVLAGSAPRHSDVTPRPRGTTGSALALFSVRKLLSVILKQLLLQWKFLL